MTDKMMTAREQFEAQERRRMIAKVEAQKAQHQAMLVAGSNGAIAATGIGAVVAGLLAIFAIFG